MKQVDTVGLGNFALPFEYVELVLTFGADLGVPLDALLRDSGVAVRDLTAQPRVVGSDSYSRIVSNLFNANPDPMLPWCYGQRLSQQPHGLFGLVLRSASRLRDAYDQLPQNFATRSGGSQVLELRKGPKQFDIVLRSGNPHTPDPTVRFHTITSLSLMVWLGRSLTGSQDKALGEKLFVAWPATKAENPLRVLPSGVEVIFDHPESFLRLRPDHLEMPVKSSDGQLNSAARSRLQRDLSSPPDGLDTIGKVKWAVRKLGLKASSIASVSELLGMSAATLKRHLKAQNHSFLAVKNEERFGEIIALLDGTDLPLEEIAYRVGYDNPSNLSKAFQQRYGKTPGSFRQDKRLN